jgi:hypothetical protein
MHAPALAFPVTKPRGTAAKAPRKTFEVLNSQGRAIRVAQLAAFTHEIEGRTFHFVVTANSHNPALPPVITHAVSRKKLCSLGLGSQRSANTDYTFLARVAINALLRDCGSARVASVLIDAEAAQQVAA